MDIVVDILKAFGKNMRILVDGMFTIVALEWQNINFQHEKEIRRKKEMWHCLESKLLQLGKMSLTD